MLLTAIPLRSDRAARSGQRPLRLEAQDTALSRRKHGLESRWGHQSFQWIRFLTVVFPQLFPNKRSVNSAFSVRLVSRPGSRRGHEAPANPPGPRSCECTPPLLHQGKIIGRVPCLWVSRRIEASRRREVLSSNISFRRFPATIPANREVHLGNPGSDRDGGADDGMRPKPGTFPPGHHRSFTSQ